MNVRKFKRLKGHWRTLHALKNSKSKQRNQIISNGNNDLIKSLCEITNNTLNGNVKLNKKCVSKIKRYKTSMRNISDSKRSLSSKRRELIQKGGFLPVILGALLSGVIGKLLDRISI